MFIGHYALGFGAKRIAPVVSLGTLFLACQFADLLWPTLVLLGVEVVAIEPGNTVLTPLNFESYPYSHSLVMMLAWSAAVAVPLEVGLFGVGVWLYARSTTAKDRTGTVALWSLVVFFLLVHAANLLSPPPPSVAAVAWSAQALWLVVAWGYWIDRHRLPVPGSRLPAGSPS